MSQLKTNRWKLGLFVAVGLAGLVGAAFWIGAATLNREVIQAVTYFDESVVGLDLGSPVRFRGVTIGTVSDIRVAPDRRHLEVTSTVFVDRLRKLGLVGNGGSAEQEFLQPTLRAQLVSPGITGIKSVAIDYFDPVRVPPPPLEFEMPRNYLPAAPSTLKSVEDAIASTVDQMPGFGTQVITLLTQLNRVLEQVAAADLPKQTQGLIARATEFLDAARKLTDSLDGTMRELAVGDMSQQARDTLAELRATFADLRTILADVQQGEGPLADVTARATNVLDALERAVVDADVPATSESLRAAGDSLAVTARDAGAATRDLERTLSVLRDAADSVRELSEVLQRDPGSVLYGRSYAGPPPRKD